MELNQGLGHYCLLGPDDADECKEVGPTAKQPPSRGISELTFWIDKLQPDQTPASWKDGRKDGLA